MRRQPLAGVVLVALALVFVALGLGVTSSVTSVCRQNRRDWITLHRVIVAATDASKAPAQYRKPAAELRARLELAEGPRPTC